jgi:hypothetical protein
MEQAILSQISKARQASGAMFFSIFGCAWLIGWSQKMYGIKPLIMLLLAAGGAALFAVSYWQFRSNRAALASESDLESINRKRRIFRIVNAVQWISIFIVGYGLSKLGFNEWIMPSVVLIIGFHFIFLAAAFRAHQYYFTGLAMIALVVLYPILSDMGPSDPIVYLGTGLILWMSAVNALVSKAKIGKLEENLKEE